MQVRYQAALRPVARIIGSGPSPSRTEQATDREQLLAHLRRRQRDRADRRLVLCALGGPDALEVRDVPAPDLATQTDVRIRVHAAAINRLDLYEGDDRRRAALRRTSLGFVFKEDSDKMDLTVASFDDPSPFTPKHHFGAESIHRAWLNTEGLREYRTDEYPKLVDKWVAATGKLPD